LNKWKSINIHRKVNEAKRKVNKATYDLFAAIDNMEIDSIKEINKNYPNIAKDHETYINDELSSKTVMNSALIFCASGPVFTCDYEWYSEHLRGYPFTTFYEYFWGIMPFNALMVFLLFKWGRGYLFNKKVRSILFKD